MNESIKTLGYDASFGHVELAFEIQKYADNNNLYIGLYMKDDDDFDFFSDMTVNLREVLRPNEAYIQTYNGNEGMLEFIEKNRLGAVLPDKKRSGFNEYTKVAFDMERLAEFDRPGVENFLNMRSVMDRTSIGNMSTAEAARSFADRLQESGLEVIEIKLESPPHNEVKKAKKSREKER